MGGHVWARGSGRHPHWPCMLSAKDKLEFSYRTLKFWDLVKIIIEFPAITSKKKNEVGYLSKQSISPFALSPPSHPSPHPHPPSHPRLSLWRSSPYCDSDASNPQPQVQSRSLFFSSLYAVILLLHQGNKSFVPFSNLSDVDSLTKTWKVPKPTVFSFCPSPPLMRIFAVGLYQGRQFSRARSEAREP